MQIQLKLSRDGISPKIAGLVRKAKDPSKALRAAGEVLVQMAKRSFDEPAIRVAPWAPLRPATLAAKARAGKSTGLLKASGTLWRSLRVLEVDKTRVAFGSDRPYAGFHQIGTRRIPARPFFPITGGGKLSPLAKQRVESALKKTLLS